MSQPMLVPKIYNTQGKHANHYHRHGFLYLKYVLAQNCNTTADAHDELAYIVNLFLFTYSCF